MLRRMKIKRKGWGWGVTLAGEEFDPGKSSDGHDREEVGGGGGGWQEGSFSHRSHHDYGYGYDVN